MNSSARDFGSALCCTSWRQKLGFKRRCRGKKRLAFTTDSRSSFVPDGFMPDSCSAGDRASRRYAQRVHFVGLSSLTHVNSWPAIPTGRRTSARLFGDILSARIAESPPKGSLAAILDGQSYRGGFIGGSVGASVAPGGFAIVESVSTLNFL